MNVQSTEKSTCFLAFWLGAEGQLFGGGGEDKSSSHRVMPMLRKFPDRNRVEEEKAEGNF